MARQPRLTVPGYPHHIILRGNNRQAIVLDDADRRRLLDGLGEQAALAQVAVNAYVLMSNHLHLLLTPETAEGIPRLMQALGRNYVQAFNRRHARTGTLWSWTVQRFQPKEPFIGSEPFEPYGVGYIELDGEIIVESRLTTADPDQLEIGQNMELVIVPFENALTFAFTPAADR